MFPGELTNKLPGVLPAELPDGFRKGQIGGGLPGR